MSRKEVSGFIAGLVAISAATSLQANLAFNFIPAGGTSQQAIDGFAAAGARWSAVFADNVTVNINIAFTALGPGILGSTSSSQGTIDYASTRLALIDDITTGDDVAATTNLQLGPGLKLFLNASRIVRMAPAARPRFSTTMVTPTTRPFA